jgi:hypothetical protein
MSFLMALFLVLCVSMVSAAVSLQGTYDEANPNFGGEDQEASNPESSNDADEDIYINSATLVLTSNVTAPVDVTNVNFVYTYSFSSSDLNLSVTGSLPTGITNTVNGNLILRGRVPEDLDSVETDEDEDDYLMPRAFRVADAVLTFSDSSTLTIPVYMQRKNMLEFESDRVYFIVNQGSEDRVKDGESTEEIRPGDDVEVKITAENLYSSSDDLAVEDVVARILLDGDTDNDWDWEDIDEEADIGTVSEGEEDEESVEFTVDEDVEKNGNYEMHIYLTGTDENGAEHGQKMIVDFDVQRKKYDFIIARADLAQNILSCSRTTTMDIKIESLGYRGDDEVSVYIKNDVLGIDTHKTAIDMDEFGESDDTYTRSFQIVVPEDTAAATYTLRVSVYYSGTDTDGVHADERDVELIVRSCALDNTEKEEEEIGEEVTVEDSVESEIPYYILDEFGITESVESSFKDSTAYTVLLVVAILAALGSIGLLVFLFLRR